MEGPRGYFPQVVAYIAAVPATGRRSRSTAHTWASGDVPIVSNGPFKVDAWEHEVKSSSMSKNEGYWNAENIALDQGDRPDHPGGQRRPAYEAGEGDQQLDWTILGATDLPRFQDDPELSAQLKPYVYSGHLDADASNGDSAVRRPRGPPGPQPCDRPRAAGRPDQRSGQPGLLHGAAGRLRLPRRPGVRGDPEVRSRTRRWTQLVGHRVRGRSELARDHDVHAGQRGELQLRHDGQRHRRPAQRSPRHGHPDRGRSAEQLAASSCSRTSGS